MSGPKFKLSKSSTIRSSPQYSMSALRVEKDADDTPGPGAYGNPKRTETFSRSASYGFGSSVRESNKVYKTSPFPGPGTYTPPKEPHQFIPNTVFGGEERLPKTKVSCVPPPGTYVHGTTLKSRPMSMLERRPGKAAFTTPAPGTYKPGYTQTFDTPPRTNLSTTELRENADTFKSKTWRSGAPDPGTYKPAETMGANLVMSRSAPSFSFSSRRKPHTTDKSPGPIMTDYTALP